MEIKKILWPTDFSENSNAALPYILSLSKKYDAEIHLLSVAEDITDYKEWYGELTSPHAERVREWEVPRAEKKMEEICEKDLAGCPMFHKKVVVGDPAREIVKTIEVEKPDVVIMAIHGRGGHFEIGSVTDKVVRNSPSPVWTVRPFQRTKPSKAA
jgi:nucleotide-binding universal stress UspA family protein